MNPSEQQLHQEAQLMYTYARNGCEKFDQGKYKEAIDWFTKAINVSEFVFDRSIFINRGTARMVLGQYREAIEDFTRPLVKLQEKNCDDKAIILQYKNLGYCYYKLGKIPEAKACYEKVLLLDLSDFDAAAMLIEMK